MSMSLDGFIADPNERRDNPLGDDGHLLHGWFPAGIEGGSGGSRHPRAGVNVQIFDQMLATGAVVAGAGTFEPTGGINDQGSRRRFRHRAAARMGSAIGTASGGASDAAPSARHAWDPP